MGILVCFMAGFAAGFLVALLANHTIMARMESFHERAVGELATLVTQAKETLDRLQAKL